MCDKKLLEEIVKQINNFQSPERKEQAFKLLNSITTKQDNIGYIEAKIKVLERRYKELVHSQSGLAESIFGDIKALKELKEIEDKNISEQLSNKKEKVKIPIILVWD